MGNKQNNKILGRRQILIHSTAFINLIYDGITLQMSLFTTHNASRVV